MKILICIILCSFASTSYASSIVPNLMVQMKKQENVDKEKTILQKKMAIQKKKEENAQKLAVLKVNKQNKVAVSKVQSTPVSTPKQVTVAQVTNIVPKTIVVSNSTYIPSSQSAIRNIDMNRVRTTWLSWYNAGRIAKWLGTYSYDSRLDSTAHDWNTVFAASRWSNFHERHNGDGYYNYPIINQWFIDRGINAPIVGGVNNSENVSWWTYYPCSQSDCTDEFLEAIKSSYIFFINSPVHAKSVYQPNFTKIGFDIIFVPNENHYYITVHYMTK